jgi:hypothetical protein
MCQILALKDCTYGLLKTMDLQLEVSEVVCCSQAVGG